MKKLTSLLLTLAMLLSLAPAALAAGTEDQLIIDEVYQSVPEEGLLPDSQEILDMYAEALIYPETSMELFAVAPDKLKDQPMRKALYDAFSAHLSKVALGEASGYLHLEWTKDNTIGKWTLEQLGVSAQDQVTGKVRELIDMPGLISYLCMDMPYELYWFDKTQGVSSVLSIGVSGGEYYLAAMDLSFAVANEFRSAEESHQIGSNTLTSHSVKADKVNSANAALINAQSIVEKYKDLGDYEKLDAYRQEILALAEYDKDVVLQPDTEYGDPWQLVNVFDGNTATKSVCEGYAKAFQYLCDHSSFQDPATVCYTVVGELVSAGPHMWNIVSLGGKNYVVDLTLCDDVEGQPSIASPDQLFLAGAAGDPANGYTVALANSQSVAYKYRDDQAGLLGEAVLSLADSKYDPAPQPVHEQKGYGSDESGHWGICSVEGCAEAHDFTAQQPHSIEWNKTETEHQGTCSVCGYQTAAAAHDFSNGDICAVCGYQKPVAPQPEHQHSADKWEMNESEHWHICQDESCKAEFDRAAHDFSAGDSCAVCGYQKPVAPQPEHQHSAGKWEMNESEHWHICQDESCKAEFDRAAHQLDENGLCSVCGYQKPVETVPPTEAPQHNIDTANWQKDESGHWNGCDLAGCGEKHNFAAHSFQDGSCTVCGFADPNYKPEPQHAADSSRWAYDASGHWHPCFVENCPDHRYDEAPHNMSWTSNETDHSGSCACGYSVNAQLHEYDESGKCKVCGHQKAVEPPKEEHNFSAAWTHNESQHWHACLDKDCNVAADLAEHSFTAWAPTDKDQHQRSCTVCGRVEYQKHDMKDGKCSVCGYEDKHSHSFDLGKWEKDVDYHWHQCSVSGCQEISGKEAHKFGPSTVIQAPTTTEQGKRSYTCQSCGYVKIEAIPTLPIPSHDHNWSPAWSSNATHHWKECTVNGCPTTALEQKYNFGTHQWSAWRTVTAATATAPGSMERACAVCGFKEVKQIPASGGTSDHQHSWGQWKLVAQPNYWERTCQSCGARDIRITSVTSPVITAGNGGVWRQGSTSSLSFTSSAPANEFINITIDNYVVDPNYYTASKSSSGTVTVVLKTELLRQLATGKHTLGIVSSGGTAQAQFDIQKSGIGKDPYNPNNTNPWGSPQTGDSANMALWISLIVISLVGVGVVAVIVVKKSKNKKQ